MAKKKKDFIRRAARRERAKTREDGSLPEEQVAAQEQAADEAVKQAAKAVPVEKPARAKKAPKPKKAEAAENAWHRLTGFLREVKIEARKINWPAVDDTWKSTWVTVIFIVALSLFMGVASWGFNQVSRKLFGLETLPPAGPVTDISSELAPGATDGELDTGTTVPAGPAESGTTEAPTDATE
jgi:preprotein translocase subunit SecE